MKTTTLFLIIFILIPSLFFSQVGINTTSPDASSSLDITSTNSGILVPRMTEAQKNLIATPATGLLIYQTDNNAGFYYYDGAIWIDFGAKNWSLSGNLGTNPATNYIGTNDAVDFVTQTSNIERTRLTSGGRFGIGITAPTQQLDVQGGNARLYNTFIGDVGYGSTWAGFAHELQSNTTGYSLLASDNGNFTLLNKENTGFGYIGFRVGNFNAAVITNAGNMGVGTTNPLYRFDNVGLGAGNVDFRTTGRIWTNSSEGGMWLSDLQDSFMGNMSATQFGFWTNSVGWNALNITKANGYVGLGTTTPSSRLHVVSDGDNIPVVYGINTNNTASTTSYGVRGECSATGLGSAGVSGVSTNLGQNEIGVLGDYGLWGASLFGLAWASSYADMPATRDFGVFATCNFSTGTGVYSRDMNNSAGSFAFYGTGKFAVTGAKAASVPTTKGNQLLYCTESPEIWFEDLGGGKLTNGVTHIALDEMYLETVFIDAEHTARIFLQEEGESNGLIVIKDNDGKGFTVKEKNGGTSNIAFSYRIMAKRRFYQNQRFGVDSNQPFGNNLINAKDASLITTDPQEMSRFVEEQKQLKESIGKK